MIITAVIPAKNEAPGIARVITGVAPYVQEVVVVDGHSTDETAELARQAGAVVYLDNRRGKGDAYKVGIEKASGDIIVFLDADGSHEPADIPKILQPIIDDKADLVIASRHRGGSDEWEGDVDTWLRSIGSGLLSVIINWRWRSRLTDVLNGFRAGRRDALRSIRMKTDDFDVEQHMVVQFLKKGFRVAEVGSHEYCRGWGKSKLPTFRKAHIFFGRLFLDLVSRS